MNFPRRRMLSLAAAAALLVSGSAWAQKTELQTVGWRELILVLLAVILFAALLNYMGIIVAITVLILVSAVASYEFNLRATVISIVVLLVMSYVVFVWGLELQFPVWPKFMRS